VQAAPHAKPARCTLLAAPAPAAHSRLAGSVASAAPPSSPEEPLRKLPVAGAHDRGLEADAEAAAAAVDLRDQRTHALARGKVAGWVRHKGVCELWQAGPEGAVGGRKEGRGGGSLFCAHGALVRSWDGGARRAKGRLFRRHEKRLFRSTSLRRPSFGWLLTSRSPR
jgi:hypothetical protein